MTSNRLQDALAREAAAHPPSVRTWRRVAAIALFLLAGTVTLWIRQTTTATGSGVVRATLIEEAPSASDSTTVAVLEDSTDVFLVLPVSVDADTFPLWLKIVGDDERPRFGQEVTTADLDEDRRLLVAVSRRLLPDGRYRVTLGLPDDDAPRAEYRFRVVGAPGP